MTFQLFNHIDQLDIVSRTDAAKEFYVLLARLQEAAKLSPWALYPNFVDYAKICFWAIRKHEYSFIAKSFAQIEAEVGRPLRVLDVGCGVVPMCNWISNRGHHVTALDPLQADIEFLNQTHINRYYGSNVAYHLSRAEHLSFANETFDVVICVSVLEHITPGNDLLALWEMAQVLKPGGSLLITFDVSPDPIETPDTNTSATRRAYAAPFTAKTVTTLLGQIARVFEVSANELPPELASLTWEEVYTLWQAVQRHDQRDSPIRQYLALGTVLKRQPNFTPLTWDQVTLAYLRGEAALESRATFFEYHAAERLKNLDVFQQKKTISKTLKSMLRK